MALKLARQGKIIRNYFIKQTQCLRKIVSCFFFFFVVSSGSNPMNFKNMTADLEKLRDCSSYLSWGFQED